MVGVLCKTPEEACAENYWKCETKKECVPLAFICDGVPDCEDMSDEGSQYCEVISLHFLLSTVQKLSKHKITVFIL